MASSTSITSKAHVYVYLVLDASHVKAMCLDDTKIPTDVTDVFVKQARCASSADVVSLNLTLSRHAPVVSPNAALQKRKSTCNAIDTLLQFGQCETFRVYVPRRYINVERFSRLCEALAADTLRPAPEGVLQTLYAGTGCRIVTQLVEVWPREPYESPPPYDPSTVLGASNDNASSQPDIQNSNNTQARKRVLASPELYQAPAKRRLSEKAAPEPWELAIAALGMELATLREEVQQLRRGPMIDAGTQTEPLVEAEPQSSPTFDPCNVSPSQASTVENSIEERLVMVEDAIVDEQKRRTMLEHKVNNNDEQRTLLESKVDKNNEQLKQQLDLDVVALQDSLDEVGTRVDCNRQECHENLDEEATLLQIKLEEHIDQRLADVEESVKQDVRMAVEDATYTVTVQPSWGE
ncbi:hypothetical protein E4T42_03622 [Aureobasidium subglaciale]|nr:hypothetical protein E4T42_03622 [Aureobasidium subglaciale]